MIVIVMGLPGSGKSYFAQRLATAINADYINSDRVRKAILSTRTYSIEEKLLVYDEMLKQMQLAVQQKKNVVLDGTFYRHSIRKKFIQKASRFGGIIFIEVRAAESIIQQRLEQKREDSEADIKVFHTIKAQWEPPEESHLILQSTNENITGMLQTAIDYLHLKNDQRTN